MKPSRSNKIVVLAGNYKQALDWAHRANVRRAYIYYPVDFQAVYGLRNFRYVVVGTFSNRVDAEEIMDMVSCYGGEEYDDINNAHFESFLRSQRTIGRDNLARTVFDTEERLFGSSKVRKAATPWFAGNF